jgi:hypothetical protein
MKLTPTVPPTFLNKFYNAKQYQIGTTNSKLNVHILKIENNQFCYDELVNELSNHMIPYALSRQTINEFEKDRRFGELNSRAIKCFRNYESNEGEAGELLLFCFLESHLLAPKIFTKLEIKTSSNDYAKGSDGVHLLQISEKKYQLIFGESKLDKLLTTSISNAFKSINDFITRSKNNINDEIGLINSQLSKETMDDDTYQFLKSVLIPNASDPSPITKNNAFGIFAGFDLKISDTELKLSMTTFWSS